MSFSNLLVRTSLIGPKYSVLLSRNFSSLGLKNASKTRILLPTTNAIQHKTFSLSPVRKSEGSSHVGVWMGERVLGLGLAIALPLSVIAPNPVLDYSVVAMMVIHAHWGLEAIVVDYIRKAIFGPVLPKVAYYGLYMFSIAAMGGLLYFNYTDVGFGNAVRMLWKL